MNFFLDLVKAITFNWMLYYGITFIIIWELQSTKEPKLIFIPVLALWWSGWLCTSSSAHCRKKCEVLAEFEMLTQMEQRIGRPRFKKSHLYHTLLGVLGFGFLPPDINRPWVNTKPFFLFFPIYNFSICFTFTTVLFLHHTLPFVLFIA